MQSVAGRGVGVCAPLCVCVCVCVGERERETQQCEGRALASSTHSPLPAFMPLSSSSFFSFFFIIFHFSSGGSIPSPRERRRVDITTPSTHDVSHQLPQPSPFTSPKSLYPSHLILLLLLLLPLLLLLLLLQQLLSPTHTHRGTGGGFPQATGGEGR